MGLNHWGLHHCNPLGLTCGSLIIICIYFLLRCLLSNMHSNLFSKVIMLSPLIYRMLIYIFLLISIIIVSYNLFGTTCLLSRRFYLLDWPWHLGFSQSPLNIFVPLLLQGFPHCYLIRLHLDPGLLKLAGKRACTFLCFLLVCFGLHINFSKSDLCLTQTFCFLGLCWDTVCISASLPPDKLAGIQQLALSCCSMNMLQSVGSYHF